MTIYLSLEKLFVDSGISLFPFCLPSDKLEWINQVFFDFFKLLYKSKQTEVESEIKLVGCQCLL